MTTHALLKDYQRARRDQEQATIRQYREIVGRLVSDSADKALFDSVDPILRKLDITDADLAADVEVMHEHARRQAAVDRFTAEAPKYQEQIDALTKQIGDVLDQKRTADSRLAQLQGERHRVGSEWQKSGHHQKRLAELERKNPRLFG